MYFTELIEGSKGLLVDYLVNLYQDVPESLYVSLAALLCLGIVLICTILGIKRGIRYIIKLFFIEYVCLIYCSTVLYRSVNVEQRFNYIPFWSYTAMQEGLGDLITDNIMNIVVFVPVGLLLGCGFQSMKWHKVLLIGCGVSFSIEFFQLVLKRGFSEFDDVMHNTLGCIIGYGLYSMVKMGYEKVSKRSLALL